MDRPGLSSARMAPKLLFILALSMALATSFSLASTEGSQEEVHEEKLASPAIMRLSRLLAQGKQGYNETCGESPNICRAKGSNGPDCCKSHCVDLKSDALNCGKCGKLCRYGQACCAGVCSNVMYDARHCGGCMQPCNKGGNFCVYGMCNYAR